ncbi:MAG TPA: cytochrome C oxidase subunit IV family protein [Egibacteraceae bacterium]|nr:cytochrome C oxidase subunit IV family protein [Egibacteraceae bacterium]
MADVEHEEHQHPGVGQYVEIGIILAVMTAIEVVIFETFDAGLPLAIGIPALIVLTVLKFLLVVMWFMHLRFDHKMFRRFFYIGVFLALLVYGIVAANWFLGENVAFCCT